MFYKATIKYQEQTPKGKIKTISEQYLFDSVSFTEVEARLAQMQLDGEIHLDIAVEAIAKYNAGEIIFHADPEKDDLKWYRLKYYYLDGVEEEQPKRVTGYMMIQDVDSKSALWTAATRFQTWLVTVFAGSLSETKILRIFPYKKDNDKG